MPTTRPGGAPCGPSPSAWTTTAPTIASADDASTTACHGHAASLARMPCGIAVPSVSMPTSQPSAAAGRAPTHWTIIFMPSG